MSNVIELDSVTKEFTRSVSPGPDAGWRRYFRREEKRYTAVSDLSFSLRTGEILGFIGPNGAGKSTTLKMLSGILKPTSGQVRVFGLDPMKDRRQVTRRIAAVFGQKSQLWIHLPPVDSFKVLGDVYGLDRQVTLAKISELSEALGITPYLRVPVRKLSLGERIRCEIAASLIHTPEVLFLDEPTIGLDIDAKRSIRSLILKLNATFKTTIILTSHDLVDIEQLCAKVVIISSGTMVYNGSLDDLKERHLHIKRITVRGSGTIPEGILPAGVQVLKNGPLLEFEVDTRRLPLQECLRGLVASGMMDNITIHDRPLEDIILAIYNSKKGPALN